LPYDIELIDGLPYTGNNRLPYEIESIDGPETYVPTVMGLKQRFNRTWRNMIVIKTSCSTKSKRKRAIGSQCYCLPHWRRVVVMPLFRTWCYRLPRETCWCDCTEMPLLLRHVIASLVETY
jgi:hypothetical protein